MFHEDEACDFVLAVTHELTEILVSGHGLNDVDNHHEFCRVLARFRTTFQLSNIADRDLYWKWVKALGDFTISSLNNWEVILPRFKLTHSGIPQQSPIPHGRLGQDCRFVLEPKSRQQRQHDGRRAPRHPIAGTSLLAP